MADFSDYLFQIKQNATTIYAKNITNLLEKYYEKIFCTVVLLFLWTLDGKFQTNDLFDQR